MELEVSPDTSYAQIGGLIDVIKEVREAVEYPLTKPEIFRRIGVEPRKESSCTDHRGPARP